MKANTKIIGYFIPIVLLVIAFVSVNVYKNIETSTKGYCSMPQDCDTQNLTHAQCTGSWICERSSCGWKCESQAQQQRGGLTGSTVECVEDRNCVIATCPNGKEYKKYSCFNYKCTEIEYFSDPCA